MHVEQMDIMDTVEMDTNGNIQMQWEQKGSKFSLLSLSIGIFWKYFLRQICFLVN